MIFVAVRVLPFRIFWLTHYFIYFHPNSTKPQLEEINSSYSKPEDVETRVGVEGRINQKPIT